MATIVTRAGKGAPLTNADADNNFTNLNTDKLEINAALGTPASGVATNLTGTAAGLTAGNVTTNANLTGAVTSTGNATVLGSFSSANLAAALTDETGTGALVFATSPTLVTPALGTPASGVVTNLTGTASININGTVGATTPAAGAFTTLNTSGAVVFNDAGANVDFRVEGDTNANLLFVDASTDRVGIRTNSPIAPLTVQADANALSISLLGRGGDDRSDVEFYENDGVTKVGAISVETNSVNIIAAGGSGFLSLTGNTVKFQNTSGTEAMRITSAGNVGIGTSSPAFPLNVTGSFGAAGDRFVARQGAVNQMSSIDNFASGSDGGGISVNFDGRATPAGASQALFRDFDIYNGKGTLVLRVDGSAGNVGIGTNVPAAKLHVQTASDLALFETTTAAGVNKKLIVRETTDFNSNSGIFIQKKHSTLHPAGHFYGDIQFQGFDGSVFRTGAKIEAVAEGTPAADNMPGQLRFSTNPGGTTIPERMRITSAGNVGIGTSSPAAQLQTPGHVVGGPSGATNAPVSATTLAGFTGLGSFNDSVAVEAIDALYLRKGGQNGSSVGISFASAQGDSYLVGARIKHIRSGSNSNGHLAFETKSDSSVNTTTERLRITSAGNVGIANTNPAVKLDVTGQIRASTGILFGSDTAAANALDDYEEGSWTPTATNLTIGNGSASGRYTKIGRVVTIDAIITWGSTTSASGVWTINNLPFTATTAARAFGSGNILDTGTQNFWSGCTIPENTTNLFIVALNASATHLSQSNVTATVPMTWAVDDNVRVSIVYSTD